MAVLGIAGAGGVPGRGVAAAQVALGAGAGVAGLGVQTGIALAGGATGGGAWPASARKCFMTSLCVDLVSAYLKNPSRAH